MNNNAIDILQKTRNIVANHWHKGGLTDKCGNFCIMGAMNIVVYGTHRPDFREICEDGRDAPCAALTAHLPDGIKSVAGFNDHPSVTHADVLNLLDETIADLMGEGMVAEIDERLRIEADAPDETLVAV